MFAFVMLVIHLLMIAVARFGEKAAAFFELIVYESKICNRPH